MLYVLNYMINNREECSILLHVYIFCALKITKCLNTHVNDLAVLSATSDFTIPTWSR